MTTKITYYQGLPKAIATKIRKTGETRGAEKDTIYQNRVRRCSTVLIPFSIWNTKLLPKGGFEQGYIVLISPEDFFDDHPPKPRSNLPKDLKLKHNLLIFYETRAQWNLYHPSHYNWKPANSRTPPLGGEYVARVPDTNSLSDSLERHGFIDSNSGGQGAGIRFYEYASSEIIKATQFQLSFLTWRTEGIIELASQEGVTDPQKYKDLIDNYCKKEGLDNFKLLQKRRIIDRQKRTVCPLCLQPILAKELASRLRQVEGREVFDLTVTAANLFHVEELKPGVYNHCCYNLGWGHHHCNMVARDWGIVKTLKWMENVLIRNGIITKNRIINHDLDQNF